MSTVLKPRGHNAPPDDFIYLWARLWLTAEERDQLRADFDAMCAKYACHQRPGLEATRNLVACGAGAGIITLAAWRGRSSTDQNCKKVSPAPMLFWR